MTMKICIVTMLRFHLFNQADELGKIKDNNVELCTAWNANVASKKFSLSHIKINGYWIFGMFLYLSQKIPIPSLYSFLLKKINYRFARYAFKRLPANVDKIIFCSTHLFPNINLIKGISSEIIVDHGSLHPNFEMNLMKKENKKYNFSESGNEQKPWMKNWLHEEFEYADKIFVCSELAKKTFIDEGLPQHKIYVNKLGVSLEQFISSKTRAYDIESNNVNILSVGAVIPRKGIHRLIEALRLIEDYKVTVTCGGTKPKDPSLKKLLDNPGRNISVVLTGPIEQSKLNRYYSKTDMFILSSICDGFGMVTPQAMASKSVCLVSDNAGSKELIEDNHNGFIIPNVLDRQIFSQIIYRVLKLTSKDRQEIANQASKTVSDHLGWSKYGNDVHENLVKNVSQK